MNNKTVTDFVEFLLKDTAIDAATQVYEVAIEPTEVLINYYVRDNQGFIWHAKAKDVVKGSIRIPWVWAGEVVENHSQNS